MERVYNYATKKMQEVEPAKAAELVEKGEAIKLDMPKLNKFEASAKQLHRDYKAKVERIKESDHPSMLVEGVKEYEIQQARDEYEQATSQLADDYSTWRATQVEEAKQKAARSFIKVSEKDKQLAEQLASRYALNIAADGQDAAGAIADEIALLSDSERVALQAHIGSILPSIENTADKNRIIDAVRTVKNEDAIAYDVARQLPRDVLTDKRISDIAKSVVHDSTFSHAERGVSTEFYEKHIKGVR